MAEKDGIDVKYVYKGRVYLMHIEPTFEKYNYHQYRRQKKRRADIKKGVPLITEECKTCGSVKMANICINKNCTGVPTV